MDFLDLDQHFRTFSTTSRTKSDCSACTILDLVFIFCTFSDGRESSSDFKSVALMAMAMMAMEMMEVESVLKPSVSTRARSLGGWAVRWRCAGGALAVRPARLLSMRVFREWLAVPRAPSRRQPASLPAPVSLWLCACGGTWVGA
eukprot:COSAG02_NODE_390_length_23244_cov_35.504558_14_plen_145_part_00